MGSFIAIILMAVKIMAVIKVCPRKSASRFFSAKQRHYPPRWRLTGLTIGTICWKIWNDVSYTCLCVGFLFAFAQLSSPRQNPSKPGSALGLIGRFLSDSRVDAARASGILCFDSLCGFPAVESLSK